MRTKYIATVAALVAACSSPLAIRAGQPDAADAAADAADAAVAAAIVDAAIADASDAGDAADAAPDAADAGDAAPTAPPAPSAAPPAPKHKRKHAAIPADLTDGALAVAAAKAAGVTVDRAESVVAAAHEALAGSELGDLALPLLVAIAIRESNLRADVEACKTLGDGGRAVGLWQEHASGERRAALCDGGAVAQAKRAVRHLEACGRDDRSRMACYAGRASTDPIVDDRLALADRLAVAAQAER